MVRTINKNNFNIKTLNFILYIIIYIKWKLFKMQLKTNSSMDYHTNWTIQHHISLKEIQALFGLLAQMNIHQLESGL